MHIYSKIMGIPVPKLTMDHSVELIRKALEQEASELYHIVTLNPEITMACQHDDQLRSIIDEAGLITADGIRCLKTAGQSSIIQVGLGCLICSSVFVITN